MAITHRHEPYMNEANPPIVVDHSTTAPYAVNSKPNGVNTATGVSIMKQWEAAMGQDASVQVHIIIADNGYIVSGNKIKLICADLAAVGQAVITIVSAKELDR